MADDLLTRADKVFTGELDTWTHNPVAGPSGEAAEVGDGALFIESFANVSAFDTGEGLLMVDAGAPFVAPAIHQTVRGWRADRLDTAVYTHGHIDHVFAVPLFDAEAESNGHPRPTVVSHRGVPERFRRYVLTAGYNAVINRRQFGVENLEWPTDYRYPDTTYDTELTVEVGDERIELHHSKGETDDHTWVWLPERRILCTGDLFIWCVPNAGNPQKVPRYCREWAAALRQMHDLAPEVLLPGHGYPIVGKDRVATALDDTAALLESLFDQTLALMNEGARLLDVVHSVQAPAELLGKPYLHPVYDDPEFIVRNIWRLYGGWHDGNPANLKPAPEQALAAEVAALAGGAGVLADRARALLDSGGPDDLRLAGHLAEMAALADPGDPGVHTVRAQVFEARVAAEPSLMAKGVFGAAARESRAQTT